MLNDNSQTLSHARTTTATTTNWLEHVFTTLTTQQFESKWTSLYATKSIHTKGGKTQYKG